MNLEELSVKLEQISQSLNTMAVGIGKIEVDLRHHIEGTVQNRREIRDIKKEMIELHLQQTSIQSTVRSVGWVLGIISTTLGLIWVAAKIFGGA